MEKLYSILKQCELFQGLNEADIKELLEKADTIQKSYIKADYILRTGNKTNYIGVVISGKAIVLQEDLWGNRNVITKLYPGNFFAEPFAIVPNTVSSVSVQAIMDCTIFGLNIRKLLASDLTGASYHLLVQNLITACARKLLISNDKITHVSKRKTREKLLSYLSAQSIKSSSLTFDIPYDRQQLADYLCVDRAAMSVELSKLQKEGILKTNHNHFELSEKFITSMSK